MTAQRGTRLHWLQSRQKTIGASDVAGVLGLGDPRWHSPVRVWASKVGSVTDETPPAAAMGIDLEPYIRREAERVLGEPVRAQIVPAVNRDIPRLTANLDGYAWQGGGSDGRAVPVECKFVTGDAMSFGDDPALGPSMLEAWIADRAAPFPGGTKVEAWYCQVQAQIACTRSDHGWLAVVLGARAGYLLRIGQPLPSGAFRMIRIPRDDLMIDVIAREVPRFWARYVETNTCPPDVSPTDLAEIRRAFREYREGETVDRPELAELAKGVDRWRRRAKEARDRVSVYEGRLRAEVQDAERATLGDWIVTLKPTKTGSRPLRVRRIKR